MSTLGTDSIVLGILALVVLMKIVLLPFSIKNSETQKKMGGVSEKLKSIKETVEDKKEQMEKTMEVYKKAGVNPLSPITLLLLQIPFFITVFFVTRDLGEGVFEYGEVLYEFVQKPETIEFTFLSMNMSENSGILIAALITISQVILMRQSQKKGNEMQGNTKMFLNILPFIVGLISLSIVATVGLYWLFNNLISILQEICIKNIKKRDEEEDAQGDKENTGGEKQVAVS